MPVLAQIIVWHRTDATFDLNRSLHWRDNDSGGVSDHQPHDCLFSRLFRRRSKKTSKLRVTGLCAGNSPAAGEFPAQRASNAENVSIWWRHHGWWCTLQAHIRVAWLRWVTAVSKRYLICIITQVHAIRMPPYMCCFLNHRRLCIGFNMDWQTFINMKTIQTSATYSHHVNLYNCI